MSGHRVLRGVRAQHAGPLQDRLPRYECSHSRADHVATPRCGSVRSDTIDVVVAEALLAAVEPTQLALALAAADEVTARRRRSVRAAELAVERAHYSAQRAERAFLACEPENRLVARSLETRWETALAELAEANTAGRAVPNPAGAAQPGTAGHDGNRPAGVVGSRDYQRQRPQAPAAHPASRCHHHPVPDRPHTAGRSNAMVLMR